MTHLVNLFLESQQTVWKFFICYSKTATSEPGTIVPLRIY